jgi:hypothetical protein
MILDARRADATVAAPILFDAELAEMGGEGATLYEVLTATGTASAATSAPAARATSSGIGRSFLAACLDEATAP